MPFLDIFSKSQIAEEEIIKITVDNRERNSLVASELIKRGAIINFQQLAVADYLVKEVAIERKTISDLKLSIINKRILAQLPELKQYQKHLLIIEGILEQDLYKGPIHENAFRGFLLSLAFDYKIPLIFTQDPADTAKYLLLLAKKQAKGEISLRPSKIALTKEEQLQFILEGFPYVGPVKAKKLLAKFKSIKSIMNAGEHDLEEILGAKAQEFKVLIEYAIQIKD